ncbi:MAG: hypothetical protein WC712_01925 [Candidatus Brocadiia bacterium]
MSRLASQFIAVCSLVALLSAFAICDSVWGEELSCLAEVTEKHLDTPRNFHRILVSGEFMAIWSMSRIDIISIVGRRKTSTIDSIRIDLVVQTPDTLLVVSGTQLLAYRNADGHRLWAAELGAWPLLRVVPTPEMVFCLFSDRVVSVKSESGTCTVHCKGDWKIQSTNPAIAASSRGMVLVSSHSFLFWDWWKLIYFSFATCTNAWSMSLSSYPVAVSVSEEVAVVQQGASVEVLSSIDGRFLKRLSVPWQCSGELSGHVMFAREEGKKSCYSWVDLLDGTTTRSEFAGKVRCEIITGDVLLVISDSEILAFSIAKPKSVPLRRNAHGFEIDSVAGSKEGLLRSAKFFVGFSQRTHQWAVYEIK